MSLAGGDRKELGAKEFCSQALAYLKIELPLIDEPTITVPYLDSPILRRLKHGLLAAYVVDQGESFAYVQNRHLQGADLSADELHIIAVRNLASFAASRVEVKSYGAIYAVFMGGNFEASLVLVDAFWSETCAHLAPNGFVAAFPARDILAFGDASSDDAVQELRQLCLRVGATSDHPLTDMLFRRVDSSWLPLAN